MGREISALRSGILAGIGSLGRGLMHTVFPPRCIACGEAVASDFGLCTACWADTPFITGLCCDLCGAPLPGEDPAAVLCDDCLRHPRPWQQGRSAMLYAGAARRMVLGLKHGDRLDLVRPMSGWLERACQGVIEDGMLIAPVPLHRKRLIKRRFNQSALLAQALARRTGQTCLPDLFLRHRATPSQEGRSREERFENLSGAISIRPRHVASLRGRTLLIVDDVMTSGATLSAATEAAIAAGAQKVCVAALARVAKHP